MRYTPEEYARSEARRLEKLRLLRLNSRLRKENRRLRDLIPDEEIKKEAPRVRRKPRTFLERLGF